MTLNAKVTGVYAGDVAALPGDGRPSAIAKLPISERVTVTRLGLSGDHQADLRVHGGPDKALHHYAAEHYAHWRTAEPGSAEAFHPGGFGENISTTGLTEANICIGDVFALGSARVQISQGRQPCWKLNVHTGCDTLVNQFQETGFTGWYYRVLTEGQVRVGDTISLIDRPNPDFSIDAVIAARLTPGVDPSFARALSELPELATGWRTAFARKAEKGYVEDTRARIQG